jgi:hypothetical protein
MNEQIELAGLQHPTHRQTQHTETLPAEEPPDAHLPGAINTLGRTGHAC